MQTTIVRCVEGDLSPTGIGICDAHNHLWIDKQDSLSSGMPILDNFLAIQAELIDYRLSGGQSIVDCQPGDCGRDGTKLKSLSQKSGVHIVACTGFHLRKYYPTNHWLFNTDLDHAREYFLSEITLGLRETLGDPKPVRAGFIKVACLEHLADSPVTLLKAASQAAIQTGVAIEIHTEKGCEAEKILDFFLAQGIKSDQIILCHMDKRPDFSLHKELVTAGVLLEYDTFYRPKYEPEVHVWKLIEEMVKDGADNQIALATDMAETAMWTRMGHGPGLAGFPGHIQEQLHVIGFTDTVVAGLMGSNIASRLAFNP